MPDRRGPSRRQLGEYVDTLQDLVDMLRVGGQLEDLLERDASLAVPDGFGPGTLGGGGSGKSDPTLGAAIARLEGNPATDYVHQCVTSALSKLDSAVVDAGAVVRLVREGFRMEEKVRGVEHDQDGRPIRPTCVEPACEDKSMAGREGRCEPCYRWR